MTSDVKEKTIKSVQNEKVKNQQRAGNVGQQLRALTVLK